MVALDHRLWPRLDHGRHAPQVDRHDAPHLCAAQHRGRTQDARGDTKLPAQSDSVCRRFDRINELLRFYLLDVALPGTWIGSAELGSRSQALAPIADLPVRRVADARHTVTNLNLESAQKMVSWVVAEDGKAWRPGLEFCI